MIPSQSITLRVASAPLRIARRTRLAGRAVDQQLISELREDHRDHHGVSLVHAADMAEQGIREHRVDVRALVTGAQRTALHLGSRARESWGFGRA
jgi:hypothetical protein